MIRKTWERSFRTDFFFRMVRMRRITKRRTHNGRHISHTVYGVKEKRVLRRLIHFFDKVRTKGKKTSGKRRTRRTDRMSKRIRISAARNLRTVFFTSVLYDLT